MMPRDRQLLALVFSVSLLALASGCEVDKTKRKVHARDTIGKTTQDVRNLEPELEKGGQTTDGKIHATDYITIQADAYRTSVANIAKMKVKMDMDMYEATNGEKPKTYEEFMEHDHQEGQARRNPAADAPLLPGVRLRPRERKNSSSSSIPRRRRRCRSSRTRSSDVNDEVDLAVELQRRPT